MGAITQVRNHVVYMQKTLNPVQHSSRLGAQLLHGTRGARGLLMGSEPEQTPPELLGLKQLGGMVWFDKSFFRRDFCESFGKFASEFPLTFQEMFCGICRRFFKILEESGYKWMTLDMVLSEKG